MRLWVDEEGCLVRFPFPVFEICSLTCVLVRRSCVSGDESDGETVRRIARKGKKKGILRPRKDFSFSAKQ